MTTRQAATKAAPGAAARLVRPEAHAAEAYLRQAHWKVLAPDVAETLLVPGFSEGARAAQAAGERDSVSGLTFGAAQGLLDWLQNQGCTQLQAAIQADGVTVSCVSPPGLRL
jgi:hypothetical protein